MSAPASSCELRVTGYAGAPSRVRHRCSIAAKCLRNRQPATRNDLPIHRCGARRERSIRSFIDTANSQAAQTPTSSMEIHFP